MVFEFDDSQLDFDDSGVYNIIENVTHPQLKYDMSDILDEFEQADSSFIFDFNIIPDTENKVTRQEEGSKMSFKDKCKSLFNFKRKDNFSYVENGILYIHESKLNVNQNNNNQEFISDINKNIASKPTALENIIAFFHNRRNRFVDKPDFSKMTSKNELPILFSMEQECNDINTANILLQSYDNCDISSNSDINRERGNKFKEIFTNKQHLKYSFNTNTSQNKDRITILDNMKEKFQRRKKQYQSSKNKAGVLSLEQHKVDFYITNENKNNVDKYEVPSSQQSPPTRDYMKADQFNPKHKPKFKPTAKSSPGITRVQETGSVVESSSTLTNTPSSSHHNGPFNEKPKTKRKVRFEQHGDNNPDISKPVMIWDVTPLTEEVPSKGKRWSNKIKVFFKYKRQHRPRHTLKKYPIPTFPQENRELIFELPV